MILSLLLSFLHLLALVLVVRLTLPARYFFVNPYLLAIDTLTGRLLNNLRTALPLPTQPLCLLTLGLILAARAALSTKVGTPSITLSGVAIAGYDVTGFLGWFGVEVLRFIGFYIAVLTCGFLLRLWHLGKPLPGYSGDILKVASRPFSHLPLPTQAVGIILLTTAYILLVTGTASTILYPLAQNPDVQRLFTQAHLPNIFNFGELEAGVRLLLLVGLAILDVLAAIQGTIFILILMLIITMIMGTSPMGLFLMDVKRLICGPIPPLRVGPLDLSLPLLYIVLLLIYIFLASGLFIVAVGVSYVV